MDFTALDRARSRLSWSRRELERFEEGDPRTLRTRSKLQEDVEKAERDLRHASIDVGERLAVSVDDFVAAGDLLNRPCVSSANNDERSPERLRGASNQGSDMRAGKRSDPRASDIPLNAPRVL